MASSDCAPDPGQELAWNADQESSLFHSMQGHRPIGIAKHFHMAFISHSFSNTMGYFVSPSQIWKHLHRMYDLETLDEREDLPFKSSSEAFSLPTDYLDEVADDEEEDRDVKSVDSTASSSALPAEKKGAAAGARRSTPEPSAFPASTGTGKRKRTRVSNAASSNSSPPSPTTPAAKRRRA